MSDAAAAQAEEIRRILLNRHLDNVFCGTTGPKRPGSAPPQAEVLPGSPMGPAPTGYNIITGEPLRSVGGGQQLAAPPPPAQPKAAESEDLGLGPDAEEALRCRPDYVAYYYANVRNNPRLPPPLQNRNVSAPWAENGKTMTSDGLAEVQGKSDSSDAQAQATFNMLFGNQLNLKDGTEPIPIGGGNYLGQDLGPQVSSSLGATNGLSPTQRPDTLAAAWANIGASAAANSAAQQLDSLLGAYGSPKPATGLSPLLTAELKAQASGVSIYSARSADEQALHESLFVGSTPHTPMGSQHGGANQLYGPFNPDSPRASMDMVGRSMSSNSLGGGALGKDPKINPGPGPNGRLASVIGDQRMTLRTPSKLRIGSTVVDHESHQQLLNSLARADSAAAATDPENAAAAAAAAAAAQQLASAAQVQAAVEAFQNLPPAAATAFAAALGGGDQGGMSGGQQLVNPDVLLGGAGAQQQQMQAMYMAAAMYPMYYAQQAQQAAGMQQSIQAMQAAAMVGFPGATGGFPMMPGGVPSSMLQAAYPPSMIPGLPPGAAASLFGAGAGGMGAGAGMHDVAALAAAGLRPQQQYGAMGAGGGMAPSYPPAMMMGGSGDYTAYYQKVLEAQAQAAAVAMAGGVSKDTDAATAAAMLRAGVPPPPPPPGQPPPPPKDKRNSGSEPQPGPNPYAHQLAGGDSERRLRTNSSGRDLERLTTRVSGTASLGGTPSGVGQMAASPTHGAFAGGNMQGVHNSRLRAASGSQSFLPHDSHMGPISGGGGGGLISAGSGNLANQMYPRDALRPEGTQRRNSQRRDMLGPEVGDVHQSVAGGHNAAGAAGGPGGAGGAGPRGPRSSGDTLLDEFKANKTGRKYELREILGHVYEFSLDQHGSRFIQQKLEGMMGEDLDAAFSEVLPRILHLMTDVFGNYVVQKFLEHGSLDHRGRLAKALHGHVLQLSLQMYGCRVVQKALEVFTEDQQIELISELDGHIMRCVRDQNGNHVIQKCIECVPTYRVIGLLDNFLMCVVPLSTHPFGCRIIQRILEHVRDQRRRAAVMADILAAAVQLTQDQYGNYVIQHVLERGTAEERSSVAGSLASTVVQLSMHKFASNVIEKCLTYGSTADRDLLVNRMLGAQALQMQQAAAAGGVDGDLEVEDPVQAMMKDQFGNYVVQKVLEVCTDEQRETMLTRVRQQLHALKRYTYGKHIVARVEKLLSAGTRYQTHAKGRLLPDDEALAAAAAAAGGRLGHLAMGVSPLALHPLRDGTAAGGAEDAGSSDGGARAAALDRGKGSDGGASAHPSAPTTPPVSAGAGESGGYTGSAATAVKVVSAASSDGGGSGTERPCSGVVGLEVQAEGARLAVGEAH